MERGQAERVGRGLYMAADAEWEQHHSLAAVDVPVRITSPAQTVVDCLKFRHKIGVEIAIEALRDCRRKQACTSEELARHAPVCRMTNVMRPYLEAVA